MTTKIDDAMKGEVWASPGKVDLHKTPTSGLNPLVSMTPGEARHFARILVLAAEKAEELFEAEAEAKAERKKP